MKEPCSWSSLLTTSYRDMIPLSFQLCLVTVIGGTWKSDGEMHDQGSGSGSGSGASVNL